MTDTAGQTTGMIGPYRLDGLLGRGAMGEVHRAYDTRRDRTVALKLLSPALAHDEGFRERFRRESYAVARLSSPHIVPIHDFARSTAGCSSRCPWSAAATSRPSSSRARSRCRAVDIVGQVAEALDAAHAEGLVHRDVEPSIVVLTGTDRDFAYLVDFGIARSADDTALTHTGATVGTTDYMAPSASTATRSITASTSL